MKVKNIKTPSHWQALTYHPFSDLTDFGQGIDTESVIDHMAKNGWDPSERITIYEDQILDGRHKHSCAQKAEVDPLFQEFKGDDHEAVEFVRKKILRQHLDTGQRAAVAAKLATFTLGDNQHSEGSSLDEPSTTRAEAASTMNVSTASVDRAKAVATKCIFAIQRAYRTKEVSLTDAASVAQLTHAQQEKALDAFRQGKVSTLAEWVKKHKPKPRPKPAAKVELKDRAGRVIPDCCRDVFADNGLGRLIAELEAVRAGIDYQGWTDRATKLYDHFGFVLLQKFIEHVQNAAEEMQLALEALKAGEPHAGCPTCDGAKKDCRTCRGFGYVPEHRWQELQKESA